MMNLDTACTPFAGRPHELADFLCARAADLTAQNIGTVFKREGIAADAKRQLQPDGWRTVWRPELGVASLAAKRVLAIGASGDSVVEQFRLAEFAASKLQNITIRNRPEFCMRAFGRQCEAGPIRIDGGVDQAAVSLRDRTPFVATRRISADGKVTWYSSLEELFSPTDWFASTLTLDASWHQYWYDEKIDHNSAVPEFRNKLSDVLAGIELHCPEFKTWINLLVNEITPLKPAGRGSNSSSFIAFPGNIHLSTPYSVPSGIVAFVHESSHQYFHLVQWNIDLVTDPKAQIFSIVKGTLRPVAKVLLGYHAFVNALAALSLASARGIADGDFDRVVRHTEELVNGLGDAIENIGQTYLTDAGRTLYSRVRELRLEL